MPIVEATAASGRTDVDRTRNSARNRKRCRWCGAIKSRVLRCSSTFIYIMTKREPSDAMRRQNYAPFDSQQIKTHQFSSTSAKTTKLPNTIARILRIFVPHQYITKNQISGFRSDLVDTTTNQKCLESDISSTSTATTSKPRLRLTRHNKKCSFVRDILMAGLDLMRF